MTELSINADVLYAGGMSVLHSFWQATLLASILWAASRYGRLKAPSRYALGYSLLLGQLLLSAMTFSYYYEPTPAYMLSLPAGYPIEPSAVTVSEAVPQWMSLAFWLPGLVAAWAAGFLIGSLQLALSYGRVRKLSATAKAILPGGDYDQLHHWAGELAVRIGYAGVIRLGLTDRISGPLLVGHLKPVLLLPVALVNQLSTEEAETVILHELAHLSRYDHLLNPLQCLIEVLFYYHPAMHWISARVREEREYCCDDLVLRHGPGRLPYARALLYFSEQSTTTARGSLALTDGGGLLSRVSRFLNNQEKTYTMNTRLLLLPLLALLTLAASAAYAPAESETELASAFPTDPAPAPINTGTLLDTLPQGSHQVTKISDGKTTRLRVEDGEIRELELEGKVIPESEYPEYEAEAEALLGVDDDEDTILHGYGIALDEVRRNLKVLEGGEHQRVIERALRQVEDLDLDFDFEKLGIRLDSMNQQLEHLRMYSSADGDVMVRIMSDSVETISLPRLRRFPSLQQEDLETLEAKERALREALRQLENRKQELKQEQRGTGRTGALHGLPGTLMEESISARKEAARQMRESHLAEGRRIREGSGGCPETSATGSGVIVLTQPG